MTTERTPDATDLPTRHFRMTCASCGRDLGFLTLAYIGVPHHLAPAAICPNCVSAQFRADFPIERQGAYGTSELLPSQRG